MKIGILNVLKTIETVSDLLAAYPCLIEYSIGDPSFNEKLVYRDESMLTPLCNEGNEKNKS